MSGMSHLEPKFRGMSRKNHAATKRIEEGRLQKLLDFIDTRMQDQRSRLKKQIEDTQHSAEEMEERRHKATLQVLKNYFEVTSGRVRATSQLNHIHDERLTGVLSEPSLATVPEIDPEILSKPRSMYDRITRTLDTSRLPLIPPKNRGMINQHQSVSLPASIPNSNRSDESSTPRVIVTPHGTPSSTPRNSSTSGESLEDCPRHENKKSFPTKKDSTQFSPYSEQNGVRNGISMHNGRSSSPVRNGHAHNNSNNYDQINGYMYQRGHVKPTSKLTLYIDDEEPPTPRLGDIVQSKRGLSRHISLKRPVKTMSASESIVSLSDLQPTRKQQAASKLKHALKGGSFRIQR